MNIPLAGTDSGSYLIVICIIFSDLKNEVGKKIGNVKDYERVQMM